MSKCFFRGRNVESLTRDELIVLIKWLIQRLDERRKDDGGGWMRALQGIWKDD